MGRASSGSRGWRTGALAALALASAVVPAEALRLTRAQRAIPLGAPFLEARGREYQGPRNGVYSAVFDRLIMRHGEPTDDLGLSPNLFLRAQRAIVSRATIEVVQGPLLTSRSAGDLPAGMFLTYQDELKRTFIRRMNLIEPVAAGLAARLEEDAVRLAGIDYGSYLSATGAVRPSAADITLALRSALDTLFEASRIDVGFEVPFVAGYDRDDGSYVMIDCSVPLGPTLQGQFFPVVKLLVLHERVEKALLDEYSLRYQSAHQNALRLEKSASDALRLRWKSYDDLITAVAERIYARTPKRVSDRLDLQPYYSFSDSASVRLAGLIGKALVDTPRFAQLLDKGPYRNRTGNCTAPGAAQPQVAAARPRRPSGWTGLLLSSPRLTLSR